MKSKTFKEEIVNSKWEDKIIKLIEKEIYLASGNKKKEHWSGECVFNDIMCEIGNQIETAKKEERAKIIQSLLNRLPKEMFDGTDKNYQLKTGWNSCRQEAIKIITGKEIKEKR